MTCKKDPKRNPTARNVNGHRGTRLANSGLQLTGFFALASSLAGVVEYHARGVVVQAVIVV